MDRIPQLMAKLYGWRAAILAFIAGALSILAMAPFHLWPVMFVTFPALVWLIDGAAIRGRARTCVARPWHGTDIAAGALIGWAFGFGYFTASIYWIGYAFLVEADRYALSMPFAIAGLCGGLALFYAAAGALAVLLWRPGYARIAGFISAFFLAEAARGHVLTGFPWNLFGYALAASDAMMQPAALVGAYGLTLAALFIFTAPAAVMTAREAGGRPVWAPVVLSVFLLASGAGWGAWRLTGNAGETVPGVNLRIVQPNIPQAEKWKPENRRWIFERHLDLSRSGTDGTDIESFTHVFWPESSVPFLFVFNGEIRDPIARTLLAELIPPGTLLVIGAERADGEINADGRLTATAVYNSLFAVGAGAELRATYDKTHLVPFGEYVPFRETLAAFGLGAFSHRLEGFDAGHERFNIALGAAPPFAPLICYEIIFPGRAALKHDRPGWLVNLTNDAWFGTSTGPYQHLHFARVRAVEEGLPVVRAANTGISTVIDAYGQIRSKLDLNQTGVIDEGLPKAIAPTLFSRISSGLLILLILFPPLIYFAMVSRQGRG